MDFIAGVILEGAAWAAHAALEGVLQAVPAQTGLELTGSAVEAVVTAAGDVLGPTGTAPAAAPARSDTP
ncbi:hypothetical protein SAMN02799642_03823 [Methylobacterium brachiatum]|nr:hypothetical protein SAMN02799642_03823 [Methylobacterium brachiatum]